MEREDVRYFLNILRFEMWTGLNWLRIGPFMTACEYDNETVCNTKDEELVDKVSDYGYYKKVCLNSWKSKYLRML